jgi:2Fe-2S ferredoxin
LPGAAAADVASQRASIRVGQLAPLPAVPVQCVPDRPAEKSTLPRIVYRDINGERREVDVDKGATVMEGAIDNNVAGIVAECGGACACATCHAYIAEAWLPRLRPMEDMEDAMLESAADRRPNSRLTCQIEVTDDLDGLEVFVARNDG